MVSLPRIKRRSTRVFRECLQLLRESRWSYGGGQDPRLVEVFYGRRPVDRVLEHNHSEVGLPTSRLRISSEAGATLSYQRTERGNVLCILSPAQSEGFKGREDLIVLADLREPSKLLAPQVIDGHWRSLISYFECTALDGAPTLIDRIRVGWLRYTRWTATDGKSAPPAGMQQIGSIVKWSVSVGLSGAILWSVLWFTGSPPSREANQSACQSVCPSPPS